MSIHRFFSIHQPIDCVHENCPCLRVTELDAQQVKDMTLEMSWRFWCFSFNSIKFFYILSEERMYPGTQLCHFLSEWRTFTGQTSAKLLRVMSDLWKVAQNGLIKGNNRLKSKTPEHQMKECRSCRKCSAISEAWAICFVSSVGIRRCYL